MSDVKWIKLSVNVFDDEKFDAIKTQSDSNDIQLVWVKLLCLAGTCNESGYLVLTKEIPYTDEMLASRFGMDIGVVQRAMMIFQKLEMIELTDNAYMVSNWLKYQSGDRLDDIRKKDRERKARRREQMRLEQKPDEGKPPAEDEEESSTENPRTNPRTVTGFCSYSVSLNNLNNLETILNNNTTKDDYVYRYILDRDELHEAVKDWMSYKDERKPKANNHYLEKSMNSLLKRIVKHCEDYGDQAMIETINYTITGQWQGIVWTWMEKQFPKLEKPEQPVNKPKADDKFDDYE